MKKKNIDWHRVKEAQRRGKKGIMQPGDQEMCEEAFKADPERYGKQGEEVRIEILEEAEMMFEAFRGRK